MTDFHQSGDVTIIHRLPGRTLEERRAIFGRFANHHRPSIMIPALASELETPAFAGIIRELAGASYVGEVVLVLGRAGPQDFELARREAETLPMKATVVWPEGERLAGVLSGIRPQLDVGPPGKGRDVWIALGYMLDGGAMHAVALHDADIVTYTEELPLRLLFPVTHPDLDFQFCKGYYARVSSDALQGRATRLLVSPLVSLLMEKDPAPALSLIASMRYPLAGEFAMTADLARRLPVPRDWGLELGMLAAVSAALPAAAICQAGLCANYEHKHQALSPEDATRGLNRMAVEVTETLMRDAMTGPPPTDLPRRYRERAEAQMEKYRADALANGLEYDRDAEQRAVATFEGAVGTAMGRLGGRRILEPLPPWAGVEDMIPGLAAAVREAVVNDNA